MIGWHHWLNGHEFEQTPGASEGQGSLACYSTWGCKDSDTTEWLNNDSKVCQLYIYTYPLFFRFFSHIAYYRVLGGVPCAVQFSSVQFSRSVMSNSLRPHESQHARPPCPSPIPGFTQTHVHRVCDAIQPSHPLSSPSPPAPNLSQHQSLFQWVNSSHQVA